MAQKGITLRIYRSGRVLTLNLMTKAQYCQRYSILCNSESLYAFLSNNGIEIYWKNWHFFLLCRDRKGEVFKAAASGAAVVG
jgi:hypothetical protein